MRFLWHFSLAVVLAAIGTKEIAIGAEPTAGKVTHAASCSQADVQKSIDSARDGDSVEVPAGSATWATPVSIGKKAVVLRGAGMSRTLITVATAHQQSPLVAAGVEGKPLRITGFGFTGARSQSGTISLGGTCKDFRIDHCAIGNSARGSENGRGVMVYGYSYGVIDHCVFVKPVDHGDYPYQAVSIMGDGDASWERPIALGSAKAVYIEDCVFNYGSMPDGALDAYSGARYVFRHNTLINTGVGHHGLDSGGFRSPHSFEYYENTFLTDPKINHWVAFHFRGGTGVVFNNTLSGGYGGAVLLASYRSYGSYAPWGICDGKNPIDGNEDPSGYPCKDQVGRTTGQKLEPFYEWNNVLDGKHVDVGISQGGEKHPEVLKHIQENRDYYNNTVKPGYTPYAYPHPLTLDPAERQRAPNPSPAPTLDPNAAATAQEREAAMLLAHGQFLLGQGEPETAKLLFQQLLQRHTGTKHAEQAEKELKQMK